jgi:hypothetical protein
MRLCILRSNLNSAERNAVAERIQILSKEESEKLFLLKYEIFQLIQILVHKRASAEPMSAANELLQTPFVAAGDRSSHFPTSLSCWFTIRRTGSFLGTLVHIFRIEFLIFILPTEERFIYMYPYPPPWYQTTGLNSCQCTIFRAGLMWLNFSVCPYLQKRGSFLIYPYYI